MQSCGDMSVEEAYEKIQRGLSKVIYNVHAVSMDSNYDPMDGEYTLLARKVNP